MTWSIDDVDSCFKNMDITEEEEYAARNEMLGLVQEGSDDDSDINVRDIPKMDNTSWQDMDSTSGWANPVPSSTIPDSLSTRQQPASTSAAQTSSTPSGLKLGEMSEKGMTFVPFRLVEKYPCLYVGKNNHDLVR